MQLSAVNARVTSLWGVYSSPLKARMIVGERMTTRHRLHPLFDGYAAAENRGTLALAYALDPAHGPKVIASFSRAFLGSAFTVRRGDRIDTRLQLVLSPGASGSKAIPDAAFLNHSRECALLVESKIEPGALNIAQLRQHL